MMLRHPIQSGYSALDEPAAATTSLALYLFPTPATPWEDAQTAYPATGL